MLEHELPKKHDLEPKKGERQRDRETETTAAETKSRI